MSVDLVGSTRCLLIDFDGPICSVFAGYPAAAVADELRAVIRQRCGGHLPPAVAQLSSDPLRILAEVAAGGDDRLTREIADTCRDAEVNAVASATATPGAEDVLRAAQATGRQVVIVSNNATAAIDAYLKCHDLTRYITAVSARFDGMNPQLLKPHPFLLEAGLTPTNTEPAEAVFIGDSVTDIEAGRTAGIRTIGYANKPGKHQRLTNAGADLVIDSMVTLAEAVQQTPARQAR
ncbi:phosphoglycolate phosphatase [Actinoplanes campanulatus]|uniref:Phosphoglycolate phosphatase n=1 Tax=Actinoplanes campanulatus TaxID=113559 RepID=A0A7W5AJQ4_9ACTN|nr:HAD family hydrolase [Actinoplanes campanulatus]MBB3097380.1 phosphoglycolate phosphatase [Actinoplanes campanulatus]GGN26583.1 hydrolase [Actinoplanes campanulatus]GID38158.1 hydrolase [Actinoplanes campanulatus]